MHPLGNIFSSGARTEILRVLHYHGQPIGLRYLAALAGVHPHSAERVVAALAAEQLIVRRKSGYRLKIVKRSEHPDWPVIAAAMDAVDQMRLRQQLPATNHRARKILPFISEASLMIKRGRKDRRVA